MKKIFIILFVMILQAGGATRPEYGIQSNIPDYYALINARIVTEPGKVIENGTIIFRNGVIENVGSKLSVPASARIVDLKGCSLYPGFIDPSVEKKSESPKKPGGMRRSAPVYTVDRKGGQHWNPTVHPEVSLKVDFTYDKKLQENYIKQGFTSIHLVSNDGLFSGSGAIADLGVSYSGDALIDTRPIQMMSLKKGTSKLDYPGSLMGSIALIRQSFMDAAWYDQAMKAYNLNPHQPRPEYNKALEVLAEHSKNKGYYCFKASDELDVFRIAAIAREFKLKTIIRGNHYEYRRADDIAALKIPFILPLNFPEAPKYSMGTHPSEMSLAALKHWDSAPANPGILYKKGVKFAFTSDGCGKKEQIIGQIQKAVNYGLPEDIALAALTTVPAEFLGIEKSHGKIAKGYSANFIVTNGDLFQKDVEILSVWLNGTEKSLQNPLLKELSGQWQCNEDSNWRLEITSNKSKLKCQIMLAEDTLKAKKTELKNNNILMKYDHNGIHQLNLNLVKNELNGYHYNSEGKATYRHFSKILKETNKKVSAKKKEITKTPLFPVYYPESPFGFKDKPVQEMDVLIINAAILTMGPKGRLEKSELFIHKGKIAAIGKSLKRPKNCEIIDAGGKVVTPGIIDAHSHLAISGSVNEGTEAITAETRIADVINSDDINIYRQLAGGVTTCLSLHGSANPIGAFNQVIKLKWGALPEEMKIKDPGYGTIKFALGENVKQSNWGEKFTTRYPQSRMGVEALIRDAFEQSKNYRQEWKNWNSLSKKGRKTTIPPRRDIEKEHLLAVLDGKVKIHCHSYVQTEIQMMAELSKEFGLAGGTFVHVLEGYKVANHIRDAGWMATTFSDWWAYKFEVYDAIPYNAALMYEQGLVVSLNSDDYELGRRLNLEAAKAMKYGNVPEEEAYKMITINAAKQLFIDHRTGSLEIGKDADFVIWSGEPLNSRTKVEQTWIEGVKYFDMERDIESRKQRDEMKNILIQKLLKKKAPAMEKGGYKR